MFNATTFDITSLLTSVNNTIMYSYYCQIVFYALYISKTNYRLLATLILSSYYIQQKICGWTQTQDMLLNNSWVENLDIFLGFLLKYQFWTICNSIRYHIMQSIKYCIYEPKKMLSKLWSVTRLHRKSGLKIL